MIQVRYQPLFVPVFHSALHISFADSPSRLPANKPKAPFVAAHLCLSCLTPACRPDPSVQHSSIARAALSSGHLPQGAETPAACLTGIVRLQLVPVRRSGAPAQGVPHAEHHGLPLHCGTAAAPRPLAQQRRDGEQAGRPCSPAGQASVPLLQPATCAWLPALQEKVSCTLLHSFCCCNSALCI